MISLITGICFGLITIILSFKSKGGAVISVPETKGVVHGASQLGDRVYLTFAFLLAAFAPKALQKFAESKFPSK